MRFALFLISLSCLSLATLPNDRLPSEGSGIVHLAIFKRVPDSPSFNLSRTVCSIVSSQRRYLGTTRRLEGNRVVRRVDRGSWDGKLNRVGNDDSWVGKMNIGTPWQEVEFEFDTMSASTIIEIGNEELGSLFRHTESSSLSRTEQYVFQNSEGDTTCRIATDIMSVWGLPITKQSFALCKSSPTDLSGNPYTGVSGGLIGLAFPSISQLPSSHSPFLDVLSMENVMASPLFSFRISRDTIFPSTITLGGVNNAIIGSFYWTPVVTEGYWQVLFQAIRLDKQAILKDMHAIIDISTTAIIAPPSYVRKFYEMIDGARPLNEGLWVLPCDAKIELSFRLSNQDFPFSQESFILGVDQSGMCVGAIAESSLKEDVWIIGTSFLKNVVTAFDYENTRVGFTWFM